MYKFPKCLKDPGSWVVASLLKTLTQTSGWWILFCKTQVTGWRSCFPKHELKNQTGKTKIEFKKQRKHNDWKTMRRPRGFYPILDTHSFRQSRRLLGPNQEGSRRREHSIMDSVVGPLLRSQLRVDFILHHGVIINHNLCADICHHGTPGVRPDSHRNTSYLLIKMPKRL